MRQLKLMKRIGLQMFINIRINYGKQFYCLIGILPDEIANKLYNPGYNAREQAQRNYLKPSVDKYGY
jgi:putative ATPase